MFNRKQTFDLLQYNVQQDKPTEKSNVSVYRGLVFAMLSGVFFSTAAVIVKQMENLYPGQLAMYRFISIFIFSLPGVVKCQENILGPRDLRFLIFLRGIFGATNIFLNFLAFRYLPLGEASVIIFSVPVFVTVAARIYLKEPCGIFQTITVFTTVVGIIFTTKILLKLSGVLVVYTRKSIFGLLAAIGSLLFSTCRFIVLRKVKSAHHSIITFNSSWVSAVETAVLTALLGNFQWQDCGVQGYYLIVFGIVSFAGQTLLTMALQYELAGPVSTMRAATDIVLAFMWQAFLFHDIPDLFSSIGAALVGLSLIFVGLTKWVSSLPEDSVRRQRLDWMLR